MENWQIVDRGQTLWGPPMSVEYQMSGTNSPTRHRPDCSGYVSMCLDLPTPGLDTVSLVTTGTIVPIDWADATPGDLIGICGEGTLGAAGHVATIETVSPDRVWWTLLEQTPPAGFQRNTYSRNWLESNGFRPYQYTREADMTPDQAYVLHVLNYRVEGIIAMRDPIVVPSYDDDHPALTLPNLLAQAVTAATTPQPGPTFEHTHIPGAVQ